MADDNKVTLVVEVDSKDAQAAIDLFGKESAKTLKQTEKIVNETSKSFSGLGDSFRGLLGPIATAATIFKSVTEALEGDRGVRNLSIALASTGEFTKQAAEEIQAFSQSLSNVTGIDDDVINQQLTLAKSFGVSNKQATELVRAATNLSAVTGQDLESAVRQLGGTLDGSVGKVGLLGKEFRDLTKDQLENGGAIDLINKRYSEAGQALGDSFEGSLNKLQNAFNDAFKAIGQEIIGNPEIRQALDGLTKAIVAFAPIAANVASLVVKSFKFIALGISTSVLAVTGTLSQLAEAIGADGIASSLRDMAIAADDTTKALAGIGLASEDSAKKADSFSSTLEKLSENNKNAGKNSGKLAEKVAADLKKTQEDAQNFIANLIRTSGSEIEVAAKKAGEAFAKINDLESKALITAEQAAKARESVVTEVNEKIAKSNQELADRAIEDLKRQREEQEKNVQLALQAASSALQGGDQKQQKANVGSAITAVASSFGPVAGGIASFASKLASLSKEETKNFIRDFISAIPEFIQAIAENLPAIVEGLAEALSRPSFWVSIVRAFAAAAKAILIDLFVAVFKAAVKAAGSGFSASIKVPLFDGIAKFTSSFAEATKQFFTGIPGAFSTVFSDLSRSISDGFTRFISLVPTAAAQFGSGVARALAESFAAFRDLPQNIANNLKASLSGLFSPFVTAANSIRNVFTGLASGIRSLTSAFQPLIDAMNAVKDAVDKIGGIGGKGGGKGIIAETAERVGGALGLSSGGIVPLYAAGGLFVPRGTDTVPAMLTPGELVVPRDMVSSLGDFLDRQGSAASDKDTAILAAILSAVQQPMTVKSEVKLNQGVLADIILQLNRQNSRLAV